MAPARSERPADRVAGVGLHLAPVGPLPPQTYWFRRAGVVAVPVLLLALLRGCTGDDDRAAERLSQQLAAQVSGTASPTPRPTASVTPSPTVATPPPPPAPPVVTPPPPLAACGDAALEVVAATAAERYPVGATPALRLSVANVGPTPCVREVGPGALELLVLSGNDRIWSTEDCTPGGSPDPVTLLPQTPVVVPVTWPGVRSRPGCVGAQEPAKPGIYRLRARVGGFEVAGAVFRIG